MKITPQIKDLVLKHFVDNYEVGAIVDLRRETEIHGIAGHALESLIRYFERQGLLRFDKAGFTSSGWLFYVNIEAHDLIDLEGGFYGRFQLFQTNIEKLYLELDKLEPQDAKKSHDIKEIRTAVKDYADIITKASALYGLLGGTI